MKKASWWIGGLILLVVIAGWMRLRLETDILATLPENIPEVRALRLLRDGFTGGSDLVIALEAADEGVAEQASTEIAERLQKRTDLVKEVRWAQPMEQQAQAGAALLAWSLQNADPAALKAVRARLEGEAVATQLQKSLATVGTTLNAEKVQRASYDPLGLLDSLDASAMGALEGSMFGLVSEDGAFRLLLVTPATSVGNYKVAKVWLDQIQAEIDAWKKEAEVTDLTLRYTGEPSFQAEIGAGIEKDMSNTIGITEVLITILFWIMFKRLKPLLWIQGLLALSMLVTLGLGGLVVGKLSIMSLGFAAIVLGIIVDYAVLIIQEAREHPEMKSGPLRRLAAPGIIAGACSTATVFLSLLFSGLPGMAEMGLLVALGVMVGLGVMLGFAPKLAAGKQAQRPAESQGWRFPSRTGLAIAGTVVLFGGMAGTFLWRGLPQFQSNADALRPSKSASMDTFQWIQERLGQAQEASLPILVEGPADQLRERLQSLSAKLDKAVKDGILVRHAVPTLLVGNPQAQSANRDFVEWLLREQPRLEKALDTAGFTEAGSALMRGVTQVWQRALPQSWPQQASETEAASVLGRFIATGASAERAGMKAGEGIVLASVNLPGSPGMPDREKVAAFQKLLTPDTGAWVAGWETLGRALSTLVQGDLNRQLIPIGIILAVTLLLTFRNIRDLALSVLLLGGGLGALAATMSVLGLGWNLASLAAIPLLLGTGLDYGIHILLALQRSNNSIRHVQSTTGRAVFFSGMTTVIGFSSLFFAGNRGISSLGLACCVGTLWIMLIVLWLLPHWRSWLAGKTHVSH